MAGAKWIVVGGTPLEGLAFMGPFDSKEEAEADGGAWAADLDWWQTAELIPPPFEEPEEVLERVAKVKAPALADEEDWG